MNMQLNEKVKYEGKRFRVIHKEFLNKKKKIYERDIVKVNNVSVIIPITSNNEVIFIKQFREAINEEALELPAGLIEKGEKPIEAARRELEEETGIICNKIEYVTEYYSSAGFTDEKVHVFVAKNFQEGKFKLDEDEDITDIVKIPLEKCRDLLKEGFFKHASIYIALLMYMLKRNGDVS